MDPLGAGYALLIALGGLIGYVKAGSLVSLVMGLACGTLAGVGAYQLGQDSRNVTVLLVTSGILLFVMGSRAYNSGKFMPAGLVASLSLLMVLRLAPRLVQ